MKQEPIIEFEKEIDKEFYYLIPTKKQRKESIPGVIYPSHIDDIKTVVLDLLRKQHKHTLSLVKLESVNLSKIKEPTLAQEYLIKGYNKAIDDLEQLKGELKK